MVWRNLYVLDKRVLLSEIEMAFWDTLVLSFVLEALNE